MIVALLMGRKGSKDFPRKNLHNVFGRPLAYYPMKAAKECREIDEVYLSTDDGGLMELAKNNGVEVIQRPVELCTDEALGEDVYAHAYNVVKKQFEKESIELVVLLMCNAPTVTAKTMSEGIKILRSNPEYDSAVTVSKYNMWSPLRARKIDKDGLLKPFVSFDSFGNPKTLNCDRDSQGDVWFADMGVSIVRPKCLENMKEGLLPQKWMGQKIYPLKQWGGLDIDFKWQIPQVEYWLKQNKGGVLNNEIKHKEWIDLVFRQRNTDESRQEFLRLEKNERVTPFSKDFWQSIREKIKQEHIIAYPETERFYTKLSKFYGYGVDSFVLTAGSDAAIRNAFDLCVKPGDAVVTLKPTFAMVEVYCELYNAEKRIVSFNSDLSLDTNALLNAIDEKVALIVLANPNSPTGTYIDAIIMEKIVKRAEKFRATVLIDEAYYGFCVDTCLSFIGRFNNVMITRTFSKACGLAGLRIGYIIASSKLTSLLYKFRPLYEVNSIALLFAEAILDNWHEVESYINETNEGKTYLINELVRLNFSFVDTRTNFIHVDFKEKKVAAQKLFEQKGIKVRGGLPILGFENFLRVTLAPKPAMVQFVEVIKML